jgi:hypothetical protein
MGAAAELLVNTRTVKKLKLRFTTFRGGDGGAERLSVDAGEHRVADCRTRTAGLTPCWLSLESLPVQPDAGGWVRLRLSADRTLPAHGGGPERRELSFNLAPTWRP